VDISANPKIARRSPQYVSPVLRQLYSFYEVPKVDWGKPSAGIVCFCHMLRVPAGKFVGKPLRLREFQLNFIRDVYNKRNENNVRVRRQAVMSVGRRAGKTLLAALLILIHLCGPAKRQNSTLVSAATTRKQASIVFRLVCQMIRLNPDLARQLNIVDSTKHIVNPVDGSYYAAISAEAGGQYGEGLDLVVYDELAQARSSALYDALMTSLGSQVEPLMMIISTQAPANDHILSELIDYGMKIRDGEFVDDSFTVHLYKADDDCDLQDEEQWFKANPALGDYRDIDEFRTSMARAAKVPSLEATLRNLYLNQRVQAMAPFLTQNVWNACQGEIDTTLLADGRPVFAGLDLSARTDLSAMVMAVADDEGIFHLFPRVWTPADTLTERSIRDRARYDVWVAQGHMIAVPGNSLDYDFLATDIGDTSRTTNFDRIAYDAWRIDVFRQALARMSVQVPLVSFGQGFKSMAPAIDIFEELAINGRIRHGGHPVLRWCISNAVIERDAAGNRKLTKAKSFGRIDVAIAAIMAVAAAKLQTENAVDAAAMIG
jgi:phage terminase large subunit-like protein